MQLALSNARYKRSRYYLTSIDPNLLMNMSPYSKQALCYDSDSHDDFSLVGNATTGTSSVMLTSERPHPLARLFVHEQQQLLDKPDDRSYQRPPKEGGLLGWWLPSKPPKQPRHSAWPRSATRPTVDPFLKRSHDGQTDLANPVETLSRRTREDSTRRAPDLHPRVPDSDSSCVQDSASRRRPSSAHIKRLHKSSSRVSTTPINSTPAPPPQLYKSSNINIVMTPTTHSLEATGSWSEQEERPRSRSIAIVKRHRSTYHNKSENDSDAHDESPSDHGSTERMYDWATWCMYNRIIDHRRNSMTGSSSTSVESHVSQTSSQFVLAGENGAYAHGGSESQESNVVEPTASPWDYCHDGEVFELEI